MTSGPDFYDEQEAFTRYIQRRQRPDNPNDTIEKPVFMELLGDFHNTAILDLGCGDGRFGAELLSKGCQSYTGVEASKRMVNLAQEQLTPVGGVLHHASIENWAYPQATFDLVISRLALHYVEDINGIFTLVHHALKPGGKFLVSVEHPVITSDNSAATETGIRYNWIVDNYFVTGQRDVRWMGSQVSKFHRTIQDYFVGLQRANFTIEQLREPHPQLEFITDNELYNRRLRIPLFLLLSARRND
ncbi:MAG: class I SAM-dependent methyltransferase [Anaerolineae bacterium]|nr:class I SAM-dependent methyltransferase [Anaerolineae bacterium]